MNKSDIFIVGGGAIGKALATLLHHQGRSTLLIRASGGDLQNDTEKFSVLLKDGTAIEATIKTTTLEKVSKLDGLILLTNKSYGNQRVAALLKGKTGKSPIVILQNGLGVEDTFLLNGFPEVYRCVLFVTSQLTGSGEISFKPVAACPIGIIKGDETNLDSIVETINGPVFGFRTEKQIQSVIWKKTIVNSVFNSICPLLEADNGIFHRNKKALEIAERIIDECLVIAHAGGIGLTAAEVRESLLLISKSSEGQLISTLQDMRNNRATEIDTLNLEIVKIAASLNKEAAVTETRLLGELIKLKSDVLNKVI